MRDVVASAPIPTRTDGQRETVRVRTSRTPGVRVHVTVRAVDGGIDHRATAELSDAPVDRLPVVTAVKTIQRLAMSGPWAATAAGAVIDIDRLPSAEPVLAEAADAAAALVAANEVWNVGLAPEQLDALAHTLGDAVSECLVGTRIESNEAL